MIFFTLLCIQQRLTMRSNLDHNFHNSKVFSSVDLLNFIYFSVYNKYWRWSGLDHNSKVFSSVDLFNFIHFSVYKQRLTMRSNLGHNSEVFSSDDLFNCLHFSVCKQRLMMRLSLDYNFHNSKVFSSVN